MECIGGNGVMENCIMPRLYREAPINAIWEGSGNVQALDVLRALNKTPEVLEVWFDEVERHGGGHPVLQQALTDLKAAFADREEIEFRARYLVDRLALVMQAALLLRSGNEAVAEAFDLGEVPQRIEVYDNSHIQGTNAVGAMIVAGPEGFEKGQYRKFNIKGDDLTPGDDFGMMKEVLTRRFKRLLKEDPDRRSGQWPGLLLIDGGAGQVSAVRQIMEELGVGDVPMVGVAKGPDRDHGKEEFHRTGKPVMALRHNDPVLYFIQRLRDEAHRFAIGTHRAKRAKAVGATPLDDIPGVGAARKRALLAHFGSAKAVGRAALADLKVVDGISEAMAETIHGHFHEKG